MNSRYLKALETKEVHKVAGMRPRPDKFGPLAGRVSLQGEKPGTFEDYYIGPTHVNLEGLYVVSWAAPAAAVFFGSSQEWDSQKIRVRRRFVKRIERLTNYSDEWVVPKEKEAFPSPKPTQTQALPTPARPSGPSARSWLAKAQAKQKVELASPPAEAPTPVPDSTSHLSEDVSTVDDLLRVTLSAPRSLGLESVLSTLQAEQYSLVTFAPDKSLVIQGHAGTGKTIIATHRAAWLVDAQRTGVAHQRVLLLGPTPAWEDHVSTAVTELSGRTQNVMVGSALGLMLDLLDIKSEKTTTTRSTETKPVPAGADIAVAAFADDWKREAQHRDSLDRFYADFVGANTTISAKLRKPVDAWRRALPRDLAEAILDPSLWPLLAFMKICLVPAAKFEHVIVDEAQDLTAFEWRVLEALNAGTWTLVGDMQQRHSQRTFKRWKDISNWLTGSTWDERTINDGYRTTQAITEFAASLLPLITRHRRQSPLGRGKAPSVINAQIRRRSMESLALEECQRLASEYPVGSIAVISPLVGQVAREARKSGWQGEGRWTQVDKQGKKYQFLTPEDARGLEFDAVIVVEPAVFRADTGTNGRLYTSLTRANHELVVIHDKPLPAALARAATRLVSTNAFSAP